MAQIPTLANPEFLGFLFEQINGAVVELITLDPLGTVATDADLATVTGAEGNIGNYTRPSITIPTAGTFDGTDRHEAPPLQFQLDAHSSNDITFTQLAFTIAKGGTTAVLAISPVQSLVTITAGGSPYLVDLPVTSTSEN